VIEFCPESPEGKHHWTEHKKRWLRCIACGWVVKKK